MTYGQRVVAILVVFFGVVLAANVYFVKLSSEWASDDMRVGHGHSKFPPQVMKDPAPKGPVKKAPAPQEAHP